MEGTTHHPARRARSETADSRRGALAARRALAVIFATAAALLSSALALLAPALIGAGFSAGASNCEHPGKKAGWASCELNRGRDYKSGSTSPSPEPTPEPPPEAQPPPPPPPPSGGLPSRWQKSNSYESASDFSLLSPGAWVDNTWRTAAGFEITRTSERGGVEGPGHYALRITETGAHDDCACPRMKFEDGFALGPGDEVWMEGSWLVPDPSKLGWSRLMNLSHWTPEGANTNWIAGLTVREPGTMQVTARSYNSDDWITTFYGPVAIPRNRWFTVDLHFKLSLTDGQALTEVYLDGQRVAASAKRNMFSSAPLTIYQAGLPHFWGPNSPGSSGETVYFDAPRLTSP